MVKVAQIEPFHDLNRSPNLPQIFVMDRKCPKFGAFRHQDRFRRTFEKLVRREPEEEVVPWQEVEGEVRLAEDDVDLN